MRITRQWLRARGACYDDEQIDELVPPAGVTPQQVLEADLPAGDRIWALLHDDVLGREGVVDFARWCAERARQHTDYAAAWVAHAAQANGAARSAAADAAARSAAADAARSAANDADAYAAAWAAERQVQLDWLRARLENHHD